MNLLQSTGYRMVERRVLSWWDEKPREKQLELELYCAIAAPSLGTMAGTLFAFLVW